VNNGPTGCSDANECATGNGGCDPLRLCTNTAGGRTCGDCPAPGYVNNGETGCSDVDECLTANGGCSPPRACMNTPGGRTCGPCGPGYTDSGATTCDDVNECLVSNGGCDPMRVCVNIPGSFSCGACPVGYRQDGATACAACACFETSNGTTAACTSQTANLPAAVAAPSTATALIPATTLFGFQITLPAQSSLSTLGVYNMGADAAGLRLGLYLDAAGVPGQRVAHTGSLPNVPAGPSSAPAQYDVAGVCLGGGTYWLVGFAASDITLGQNLALGAASVSLTGYTDLPDPWPAGGTSASTGALSIWATVSYP
jgi:hypothetical protein